MPGKKKCGIDYRSLADFRYEIRRFLNFSEQAARSAGIEPQQHQALLAIKGMPRDRKATIGFVADQLQIQHHSAVELIDRLEDNGFIRRSRSPMDRREVLLRLAPLGEKQLSELSVPHHAELRDAGPKLLQALGAVMTHEGSLRTAPRRQGSAIASKRKRWKRNPPGDRGRIHG